MILAVAVGTSVLAGFIGLPYTWYRYHLAWVGWWPVVGVFVSTSVANAIPAALGAFGLHASKAHPPWLLAGVARVRQPRWPCECMLEVWLHK